jgi:hypothetical protein
MAGWLCRAMYIGGTESGETSNNARTAWFNIGTGHSSHNIPAIELLTSVKLGFDFAHAFLKATF